MGGGEEYYRMCLANGLLGVAETQAMLNETVKGPEDGMLFAHQQALKVAGATRTNALLLDFLRWRTLRIVGPLRAYGVKRVCTIWGVPDR